MARQKNNGPATRPLNPPDKKKKRQEGSTRKSIVRATQHLLAQQPPALITKEDIAKAAGTTQSLIYYYFKSKDQLFSEAMRELTESYIERRRQTVDWSEPFPAITLDEHELWWRAAANFSSDAGSAYTRLGWGYPVLNFELEQMMNHHPEISEIDAKAHILREICLNFGWVMFKDTVALGLDLTEEDLDTIASDHLHRA